MKSNLPACCIFYQLNNACPTDGSIETHQDAPLMKAVAWDACDPDGHTVGWTDVITFLSMMHSQFNRIVVWCAVMSCGTLLAHTTTVS